jgi:hypothetical protein
VDKLKLSIDEAINNLSILLNEELTRSKKIGLVEDRKIVVSDEDFPIEDILFLTIDNYQMILDVLLESYAAILKYLKELASNKNIDWASDHVREGVQSLMEIVGDSQKRIDEYLHILPVKDKNAYIANSLLFKEITHFYKTTIEKNFSSPLEGEPEWQKESESEGLKEIEEDSKRQVDFASLKEDKNYELFFLKDENDKPFFSLEMLRNIKLVEEFPEAEIPPEDPLLEIRFLKDKDVQATAKQILASVHFDIEAFYHAKISIYTHELAGYLHKALLALMLSANPSNLIKEAHHKNCIEYFADFQALFHQALRSVEYQKILAFPENLHDPVSFAMHKLILSLCNAFFFRKGGIKEEMIGFILRLCRLGQEKEKIPQSKKRVFEEEMMEKDENIRKFLSYFPSGPLSKDLDAVHLSERKDVFFCPLMQENLPSYLFSLNLQEKNTAFLRIPYPTYQQTIDQSKVLEEFACFIQDLKEKKKKHLLIDLQDNTSYQERSRSQACSEFSKRAFSHEALLYITLDKNSSFYHQIEEFQDQDNFTIFKNDFIKQFKEKDHVLHPFMETKEFVKFLNQLISWVHQAIFKSKKTLERQERLDFIEIVYQFVLLKIITTLKPDSISFTCKDVLDIGACQNAFFYLFLSLLVDQKLTVEHKDNFLFLAYAPALLVRERAVQSERFIRMLAAFRRFHESFEKNFKQISKELASFEIKQIKIS